MSSFIDFAADKFDKNQSESLRVSKSDLIRSLFTASQTLYWPDQLTPRLNSLIDQLFGLTSTEEKFYDKSKFESCQNWYLRKCYKSTFMPDLYVQSLSRALNERAIEEQPWLYKLLCLSIQNSHEQCLSPADRNTLLSDLVEIMPCLMRQEAQVLGHVRIP